MKDKKKIIIGALCALITIMAVGYALLSQQLRITGSAAITSNWQVEITNITQKEKSTGATTNSTSYTATTANFNVGLTSPGDYALYEVTVTNKGTLDAVLSAEPSVTTGNNTAITYELEGIKKGDKILKNNQTDTFTIKVQYNPSTTTQPSNLTSNIEVTLNYEQDLGETTPSIAAFTGTLYRNNPMPAFNGTLVDGEGYCATVLYNDQSLKFCADTLTKCNYLLTVASDMGDIDTSESSCSEGIITLQESLLTTYTEETKSNINKNYYLKHIINNGMLEESYVCFIADNTEHCMQGGNQSYYQTNVGILQGVQSWFTSNSGSCTINASGTSSGCSGAGFVHVSAYSYGYVESNAAGVYCDVDSRGGSYCRRL